MPTLCQPYLHNIIKFYSSVTTLSHKMKEFGIYHNQKNICLNSREDENPSDTNQLQSPVSFGPPLPKTFKLNYLTFYRQQVRNTVAQFTDVKFLIAKLADTSSVCSHTWAQSHKHFVTWNLSWTSFCSCLLCSLLKDDVFTNWYQLLIALRGGHKRMKTQVQKSTFFKQCLWYR